MQQGTYISDIAGMISLFSDIQDKIGIIANESVKTLKGINSLLDDENFIVGIKTSVANLNNLTAKLDKVLTENQENIKEITENTKSITSDTKLFIQQNKENIDTISKQSEYSFNQIRFINNQFKLSCSADCNRWQ